MWKKHLLSLFVKTLFLKTVGIEDHLLLSLDKTNRFRELLSRGAQLCQLR